MIFDLTQNARAYARAGLFAVLALVASSAMADSYNIILKRDGTGVTCAPGVLEFDKAALPAGQTSGAATSATVTITAECFTLRTGVWPTANLTFAPDATLQVHLKDLVSKQEHPVASVYGLSGVMVSGDGDRIAFTYNPNAIDGRIAFVCLASNPSPTCDGSSANLALTYHAYNLNSIPEPQTLALLLLGALGLGVVRWTRRRA